VIVLLFAAGASRIVLAATGDSPDAPGAEAAPTAAAAPAAGETPLRLRLERALGEGHAPHAPGMPSFGTAQRISGEFEETIVLDGNAEVRRGGIVLRGDRIVYTLATDRLQANGNAHFYDGGIGFSGPSLDMKVEPRIGTMPDATYLYTSRDARGTASLVEFMGPDRIRLDNAIFSTCGPGDDSWWIQANRLDLDQLEEEAAARGAKLYFEGLPILASPWFDFPLGDHRRSGFLTPGFVLVNSHTGPEADIPYYFDIAPNRDMTLTTRVLPDRGVILADEIRFLDPRDRGVITLDAMPNDRTTGGSRGFARIVADYAGTNGFGANINFNRVSDDNFLVDFSRTISDASLVVLPQTETLSYSRSYWTSSLTMARYQTLYSLLTAGEGAPYNKVPELSVTGQRYDWHGTDLYTLFDVTRFEYPTATPGTQNGTRIVANPSLSYPIQAPGYYVIPKVQWNYAAYELDPTLNPQGSRPVRSLPIASVDSGLVFEREASFFGSPTRQTIEPRLLYTRIPYRDQSQLPNFDGGIPTPSLAQIFTENVYSGWDRIGEANDVTLAVVGRVLDPSSGSERLRAAVGERFYFGPQLVTFPGGVARTGKASDLLFEVSGNLSQRWLFDAAVDYSSHTIDQVVRGNLGVRWQPSLGKDLSLSYRYDSTLVDPTLAINEVAFAGQWPLVKHLYGVWDFDYSVLDRGWVQQLFGVEYKADCWIVRVVAQRYATAAQTTTTAFFVQLELNGLTGIGQDPLDQLRRNIPGYRPITPPARLVGPYEDYE